MTQPTIVRDGDRYMVARLGERYAALASGDARRGRWLPDMEPIPHGWTTTFTRDEAALLVPLLAELDTRAAGKGGRRAAPPKTADARLVARAVEVTGLTRAALAERMGITKGVLSRPLPEARRQELRAMIRDARAHAGARMATVAR